MTFLYLLLLVVVLASIRTHGQSDGWCAKRDSDAVKGVCIILVFIAHAMGYVQEHQSSNIGVFAIYARSYIGQLMVVPFLFFSGYGVAESIKSKGDVYLASFPRRRMLSLLINFIIAVVVYTALWVLMKGTFPVRKVLLSLVAWESMGNSNWYVFTIEICYAIAWGGACIWNRYAFKCCFVIFVISLAMSVVRPYWWYNTMMAFPLGMIVSEQKVRLEVILRRRWWVFFVGSCLLFILLYLVRGCRVLGVVHNALSVSLCAVMIVLMLRFRLKNRFLEWVGSNVFPIYIYQRMPMILLSSYGHSCYDCSFAVASFAITLVIVLFYHRFRFV